MAQSVALDFALTFKDVPPVQKAATFTIDDALAKMVDIDGADTTDPI